MKRNQNAEFYIGDTWRLRFPVTDGDGVAISLVGAKLTWVLESVGGSVYSKNTTDHAALFDLSLAASGIVTVTIPASDTGGFQETEHHHALLFESGSEREHLSTGKIRALKKIAP